MSKWDNYIKEVASGNKNAAKLIGMSRRPYPCDIKQPIIMCMCSTSFCLGEFEKSSDSCPIKCLGNTNDISPSCSTGGGGVTDGSTSHTSIAVWNKGSKKGSSSNDTKERYLFYLYA